MSEWTDGSGGDEAKVEGEEEGREAAAIAAMAVR